MKILTLTIGSVRAGMLLLADKKTHAKFMLPRLQDSRRLIRSAIALL